MPVPVSRLFLPPRALAACVFAAIYRDTRGANLTESDRVNHFPASPLVSVTRVIQGNLTILPDHPAAQGRMQASAGGPPLIMGPRDDPVSSISPGEVVALTVGFYPDSWQLLGGTIGSENAPRCIVEGLMHFGKTHDPERDWQHFCTAIQAEWEGMRSPEWTVKARLLDWAKAATARAALSGTGRSLRSIERRLKRSSGHTRRTLDFYAAFETLHRVAHQNPKSALADIALASGYSDQSHMGRAVRSATGFTPSRLNRAIRLEEPFWCYRLLGERF
ncbi:MAG: helix-turn-helix domain-containing protein [Rhizobiaceae bacterium]